MFEVIITWMDWATIVFAFCAMFASGYNLWQQRKGMENIKIFVQKGDNKEELPVILPRKHFTRAELFGILGALDKDSKFIISHTGRKELMKDILDIQNGKKDEIIIKLTDQDKFNWK